MSENTNEPQYDFGIMGLGTMGRALLLNMADHGNAVCGWNRDPSKAQAVQEETGGKVGGFSDLGLFVAAIRKPRAIMILVPAGGPTDGVLQGLHPYLDPGDFVIDGGNAHFKDTERRITEMGEFGFGFMGMGVSGGEKGARYGPSMMPGGTPEQYERIRPILESVAAKYDGEPCVALMGARSGGHYVKMVHNGIEYAVMQLIAETYDILHRAQGRGNDDLAQMFGRWNQGELQSFLVEITSIVLAEKDGDKSLVDLISDKAKSKGTGKWTSQDAMDLGMPVPSIDAAVNAREVSGYKGDREAAEKLYGTPLLGNVSDIAEGDLEKALLASMILCYAQGLAQIRAASDEYKYGTDLPTVAKVWRAGCIIRSRELAHIQAAYANRTDLPNLLLDQDYSRRLHDLIPALRKVVVSATAAGIPIPAYAASLNYFDSYRTGRLPANLIQAQRDLFGAHTYERLDKEGSFHTQWE
ncbi:NADP-dependent phosphogluconate dehydrogenase [Fimbriimonas ginsengisoli]|uniref:6-phosphogluconate dehydrogenase, decarboxylating n=1 Tax=Fimbriimonas ginsengisoli Gsoil 348 TaxID=661478 RepID=A0A068NVR8_FIMGI|nr:NADP-dependent phosphogluconate dehydrogenase [Fimbriimonas ginsengisoli]AIE87462.1 6-phosphogluconate dehydrogenase, decarboxylating [Fimbriimonas ginsengisoli Gsoil 348]